MMQHSYCVRAMTHHDAAVMADAFNQLGLHKPQTQYDAYFEEQYRGTRQVLIAEVDSVFAAYLTIVWESNYGSFREQSIPEIVDLNVLPHHQRKGVASRLVDHAETSIFERSRSAGIGVGLSADYGAAQIMYIKRRYVPDGCGVHSDGKPLSLGEPLVLNHSLALYFKKSLDDRE